MIKIVIFFKDLFIFQKNKAIKNKFKNFNNELWNCRHKWEEMGRDKEAQGFSEKEFVE